MEKTELQTSAYIDKEMYKWIKMYCIDNNMTFKEYLRQALIEKRDMIEKGKYVRVD